MNFYGSDVGLHCVYHISEDSCTTITTAAAAAAAAAVARKHSEGSDSAKTPPMECY